MAHAAKRLPYVGITGIGTPAESAALVPIAVSQKQRRLMIGALVSSNSMAGKANRWPHRYPPPSNLAAIFSDHPASFNVVHYNTHQPSTLAGQLTEIAELAGGCLHGFQLNMAWPAPSQLESFRVRCPNIQVILQLNRQAFETAERLPGGVAEKLRREYQGLFDHALLDLSAGRGEILDPEWAADQLRRLYSADLDAGFGVAGGLSAETLPMIGPLLQEFPNLSIDAEGRLRDQNDFLDLVQAEKYLLKALEMFGEKQAEPAGR